MRKNISTKFGLLAVAMITLAACGGGTHWSEAVPKGSSSIDRSKTASIFSLPRFGLPKFGRGGGMPASEKQCRKQLKRYNVAFTDIPTIRESANCGISYPIKVSTLARGTDMKPAATLNCETALALAQWFQKDVGPAARKRYLSGVAEVRQMSSYSCRRIGGNGQWSEHSKGNALDIGSFELKNGRVIDVATPSLFAIRAKGFLRSVRAQACERFGTVLGPGDRDHHDHFHFDLRKRSKAYCSM